MKDLRQMYTINRIVGTKRFIGGKEIVEKRMETNVVTPSGIYGEKEYLKLLEDQASQLHELNIIEKLKEYAFKYLAWINDDKGASDYALRMYSSGMHKREDWVGYEEFQELLGSTTEVKQITLF